MQLATRVIDSSKNIVCLSIAGRIKSGYLAPLENEFARLAAGPPVKLILDLQEVVGMDSSGIGELIKARADILEAGGNVILMGGQSPVQTLMRISGLEQYFQIVSTFEEALHLVDQPPITNDPSA